MFFETEFHANYTHAASIKVGILSPVPVCTILRELPFWNSSHSAFFVPPKSKQPQIWKPLCFLLFGPYKMVDFTCVFLNSWSMPK